MLGDADTSKDSSKPLGGGDRNLLKSFYKQLCTFPPGKPDQQILASLSEQLNDLSLKAEEEHVSNQIVNRLEQATSNVSMVSNRHEQEYKPELEDADMVLQARKLLRQALRIDKALGIADTVKKAFSMRKEVDEKE